jgi:hypothetical protein
LNILQRTWCYHGEEAKEGQKEENTTEKNPQKWYASKRKPLLEKGMLADQV